MKDIAKRFIAYAKIDTQANPFSTTYPSTAKQLDLSKLLFRELKVMGYAPILDDFGYLYCKINSNTKNDISTIGLIAHVDTSFDAPGSNVKPRIITNYQGEKIILNESYTMDPTTFPVLKRVIGDDLIVTDGNTLLGADDKCGVAIIMEFAKYCQANPTFTHGDIWLCFTPDEEIGKGTDHFNHELFKAEFAYTLDGSAVGSIEFENFNAASAEINFKGISIHPGAAKGKMINAMTLAMEFHHLLPKNQTPFYTEKYEGFFHLTNIQGSVENARSLYIVRDHDDHEFNEKKALLLNIAKKMNQKYNYDAVNVVLKDSYFNMYKVLKNHPQSIDLAKQAIINCGLQPIIEPIRGGTDGARLTFEGLPCPNLGTGAYNFHSRHEFCSINQMERALDIVIEIVKLHTKAC